MTYTVHPAAALFPMMNDDELKDLAADIAAHGLRQPVVLNCDESILCDGRNRLRACEMAGADTGQDYLVTTTLPDDYTDQQILEYIVSANLHRRHLTASQRSMLATNLESMYAEIAKSRVGGRPKLGAEKPPLNSGGDSRHDREAAAQAAAAVGVSRDSVNKAKALKKEAPDLAEKVSAGDMTLNAATKERKARTQAKPQPKEAPVRPGASRNPDLVTAIAEDIKHGENTDQQTLMDRYGVTERVARDARARAQGMAEGWAEAEEATPIDWNTIPGNQQVKLDKAKASIRKQLEKEFRTRLLAELDQHRARLDADFAAHKAAYDKQNAAINALRDDERRRYRQIIEVNRAKGLITESEYRTILSCLHPDSRASVSDEKLATAFRVFNDPKIKALLVKEV